MSDNPLEYFVIQIETSCYEILLLLFNMGANHNHFEINDSFRTIDVFVPQHLCSFSKNVNYNQRSILTIQGACDSVRKFQIETL
jgi:hypothetical protein